MFLSTLNLPCGVAHQDPSQADARRIWEVQGKSNTRGGLKVTVFRKPISEQRNRIRNQKEPQTQSRQI